MANNKTYEIYQEIYRADWKPDTKEEKQKIKKKIYNRKNKEQISKKQRERILSKKYNISSIIYDEMLKAQENKCAICNQEETSTHSKKYNNIIKRLAVDHNHNTGKVRKLLCARCNKILGAVNEDINILLNMINYLNLHNNIKENYNLK